MVAPTQREIDEASTHLARSTRALTFRGGTYAFSCASLCAGGWLEPESPLMTLACLAVDVPAGLRHEPFPLVQARCRILIENALAAAA